MYALTYLAGNSRYGTYNRLRSCFHFQLLSCVVVKTQRDDSKSGNRRCLLVIHSFLDVVYDKRAKLEIVRHNSQGYLNLNCKLAMDISAILLKALRLYNTERRRCARQNRVAVSQREYKITLDRYVVAITISCPRQQPDLARPHGTSVPLLRLSLIEEVS